jgi:hypothetical protein
MNPPTFHHPNLPEPPLATALPSPSEGRRAGDEGYPAGGNRHSPGDKTHSPRTPGVLP